MVEMKWVRGVAAVFAFGVLTLAAAPTFGQRAAGRITFLIGRVEVNRPGGAGWERASLNQSVSAGDKLRTLKESRAEITLADGSVTRLNAESTLDIAQLLREKDGTARSRFVLGVGQLWACVTRATGRRSQFHVETPTAVAAIRGTVYRMNAALDSTTSVLVYEGEVEVSGRPSEPGVRPLERREGPREIEPPKKVPGPREITMEAWVEVVKALQQIVVMPDGTYRVSDFDPVEDAKDEWVRWNLERDETVRR